MGFLFKSKLESRLETVRSETRRNQAEAADPTVSAWVSANAGTGKTHVLTQRILRLLLAGTKPERILALTYTKAAAAEMAKRVFDALAKWVTLPEAELQSALARLVDRKPTAAEMQTARQLFAIAIETPGGLKVQTIHAFCERLLQRFPLEAGVAPGFAILDEHERKGLLAEAVDDMLAEAAADKAGMLWACLSTAIRYAVEDRLEAILEQAFADRGFRLESLSDDGLAGIERDLRQACGVRAGTTSGVMIGELAGVVGDQLLPMLAALLRAGGTRDAEQAERLQTAMAAGSARGRAEALQRFFLTGDSEPRKRLMTKGVSDQRPDLANALQDAQARFVALHEEHNGLMIVEATVALLRLARATLERYTRAKARRAALDFDDLVGRAADLLGSSAAVAWVLYKLDGGLEHILVDEAQDTSPVQWRVIQALAGEFFAGEGASEAPRTLFAVGDEKQSIYGFQGAAPNMFAAAGEAFADRAGRAGRPWRKVPLTLSFRAVAPLLDAVDRVFAAPERTPGLTASGAPIRHTAERSGQAGLIEIWPTEKSDKRDRAEPWAPLDEATPSSPVKRLAARIADTIAGWLAGGEKLESEDRPIRPADILILVRKRMPFAPAMVSALKARDIKVAGADRLVLTEQIAVQDLMALGDVLLLPEDDLALAAVLKSPLFGFDDEALLAIAVGRKGSLSEALTGGAAGHAGLRAAAQTLDRWRVRAADLPPFAFYAGLLDADGMRDRMLARLGAEAADAIDEFLNLALAYEEAAPPSLQGFLAWLRETPRTVKRDMEQGRNEVRVMTVHGAKGLEAPIVFLPDTCSTRSGRWPGSLVKPAAVATGAGTVPFLWPVKGTNSLGVVQQAKAAVERAETEEMNRLLYVALTRARDRLYVAGFETTAPPPDCWYNLIKGALVDSLAEVKLEDGRTLLRHRTAQTAKHEPARTAATASAVAAELPAWAKTPAAREPVIGVPLAPSRLAPLESEAAEERGERKRGTPAEPPILPPAALAQDARFLRGTLTHALLEHLPPLPPARWKAAAQAFVASRAAQLPAKTQAEIVKETLAVLGDPTFAALFGPDSRAEVPIVAEIARPGGRGPTLRLAGKIDRLVRQGREVLIVDYKTNRPPPADVDGVADAYLLQLAAYRLAVQRIFPESHIRAAILWTDGPRIMEIPRARLEASQQRLWELDPASLDA